MCVIPERISDRCQAGATQGVIRVFGESNEDAVQVGWQDRVRAAFPRGRHLRVPGANHFPLADEPELVADEIVAWWRELVAPSAGPAEAHGSGIAAAA